MYSSAVLTFFTLLPSIISARPHSLSSVFSRSIPQDAHTPAVMTPITENDLSSFLGLKRRDVNFSDLDLKDQAQMIYGTPGEQGSILLANVTLKAPSGKKLIMMERFEGLTTAIDCAGEDGGIGLTFNTKEALEYAKNAWSGGEFILITNHVGCAEGEQRKAYGIEKVEVDESALSTTLASKPIDWKEVTGTFTIDFGKAAIKPKVRRRDLPSQLQSRTAIPTAEPGIGDFFRNVKNKVKSTAKKVGDKIKDAGKKVGQKAKEIVNKIGDVADEAKDKAEEIVDKIGDKTKEIAEKIEDGFEKGADKTKEKAKEIFDDIINGAKEGIEKAKSIGEDIVDKIEEVADKVDGDLEGEFSVNLDSGTQGSRLPLFTDMTNAYPNLVITCVDCHTTGTLRFSGRVEVTDFKLTALTFTSHANSLKAKVALEVFTKKAESTGAFTFEQSILALPLPGGLVIPQIFSAGPKLDFKAGIDSALIGQVNLTVGAEAVMPDSTTIHADLLDPAQSSASGIDGLAINPIFNINKATATFSVGAFAMPVLSLGFDILNMFTFETQLRMQAPRIGAKIEAGIKEGGFCEAGGKAAGAVVGSSVSGNLVFAVRGSAGAGAAGGNLFEKVIWEASQNLGDVCLPIG